MSEIIYGMHAIAALLKRSPERFIEIYFLDSRTDKRVKALMAEIIHLGLPHKSVSRQFLDNQSASGVHQGIVAKIKPAKQYQEHELVNILEQLTEPFILILDSVTDPHNLGACLRTADAAGVDLVIVPKDRSAPLNATVKKVACGAADTLPLIRVTNLARTMRLLQERNIWIIGTASEAKKTLFEPRYTGSLALVMGAEGKGMRRLTREHCNQLVCIPMDGTVSSLNVSVATGVCLFEIVRQKIDV